MVVLETVNPSANKSSFSFDWEEGNMNGLSIDHRLLTAKWFEDGAAAASS